MTTDTLLREVGVNDLGWLDTPGDYVLRHIDRADRARLRRLARSRGMTLRTTQDVGFVRVTVWKGEV